jgi:multiple sugar transport system permease protein
MSMWGFGSGMIIFLAGLQGVPRSLIEASLIDGANTWQRFRHVTVPQISPVIFFNLVMGMIGAMQVFSIAYVFQTADSNINREATQFYVLNIFNNAFLRDRFGLACALAWVLFVIILMLTAMQFYGGRKWVHYES